MANNSIDAKIKEFIKSRALSSDETAAAIHRQVDTEFAHIDGNNRPSKATVERHVKKERGAFERLKRTPGREWEFEPFSLGALYAKHISVPPDVVTALFSAQLQTQFCSQSFSNRDAKWLVRLKAFYDALRDRNANGSSLYGFEGLRNSPLRTMSVSGTISPPDNYEAPFIGQIDDSQNTNIPGWRSEALDELINIAKTYSEYETHFQVENGEEKTLETRLLDSMLIWAAAPGIGQFLAARTPITGHPFWKSADNPADNPKVLPEKDKNQTSDSGEPEQTKPMEFFRRPFRRHSVRMQVDLSVVLKGWAKENENYLERIATKALEGPGEGGYRHDGYDEFDFEEKIIGNLFKPRFEFTRTPECIRTKLKYEEIPDVAALPSNSLEPVDGTDENLLLVLALDFLSARAPDVFKDFPETLARINKIKTLDSWFDPSSGYPHPVSATDETDMKFGLLELCLEFEAEIKDWNPKSSIVKGSHAAPFILGLSSNEWFINSDRCSESFEAAEVAYYEERDAVEDYADEQRSLGEAFRASMEPGKNKA